MVGNACVLRNSTSCGNLRSIYNNVCVFFTLLNCKSTIILTTRCHRNRTRTYCRLLIQELELVKLCKLLVFRNSAWVGEVKVKLRKIAYRRKDTKCEADTKILKIIELH